jgi:hypothetical protein
MTMPDERTRALRWAGELLREVAASTQVPEELRREARAVLRHYPTASAIAQIARLMPTVADMPPWLAPEDDGSAPGDGSTRA